ncbi:MAG TPA: hypothetical protein VKB89_03515 [Xanthobacteraceae bacterium]|nr:hypothetical protein [Xanthobacteraceae bacterium]
MKVKANGITINYQLDGSDGAPWLVLSNSLATNLTLWDEQARELGVRSACCAAISAATAQARRAAAATPSTS